MVPLYRVRGTADWAQRLTPTLDPDPTRFRYRDETKLLSPASSAMLIFGLTGGIATGKSTVSDALAELGCPVIDADVLAKKGTSLVELEQ